LLPGSLGVARALVGDLAQTGAVVVHGTSGGVGVAAAGLGGRKRLGRR
jgi:hypothetical protein